MTPAMVENLHKVKEDLDTDKRVALSFKNARPDLDEVSIQDSTIMVSCTLNVVLKFMLEAGDFDTALAKCKIVITSDSELVEKDSKLRVKTNRNRNVTKLKKDISRHVRLAIGKFRKSCGYKISQKTETRITKMISDHLAKCYLSGQINSLNIKSVECLPE